MWSNKFLTIPFKSKGRDRTGSDCWGLVRIIYKDMLGVDLPLLTGYTDTDDKTGVRETIEGTTPHWIPIKLGEEKPYDLAIFKIMGQVWHIGLVVKPTWMIHCQKVCGTIHSDYVNEREWSKRLEGFYRHAEHPNFSPTL